MKKEKHSVIINENVKVSSIWRIPEHYRAILIIAHGAGNDMNSPFISFLHKGFAQLGFMTVKFNFPYKEQGRKTPDRAVLLEATWQAVIDKVLAKTQFPPELLFLSGKSMGGRYASMIASKHSVLGGVIFFGYPLHSPGKPEKTKSEHLASIQCPLLFFQGTRDSLCQLDKLHKVLAPLQPPPALHIIVGGDHSFRVLKRLKRTELEVWQDIVMTGSQWIREQI